MTLKLKSFGKALVTREDAKSILQVIKNKGVIPTLDFAGVEVANHPFADELGKGLASWFSLCDLSGVQMKGTNSYVKNCVEAGFSTALPSS